MMNLNFVNCGCCGFLVLSFLVSIIMDVRSPLTIPTMHCGEFHMGRVISRDDQGGMSSIGVT